MISGSSQEEDSVYLRPLYRLVFSYPQEWSISITGERGTQSQHFFFAEGYCTGLIQGTFKGANFPQCRTDGTYVPDFNGVIETGDGAVILKRTTGYGRAYPVGRRQIAASEIHLSDDERYRWLNDTMCVSTGEVRTIAEEDRVELVLDVAELVWEALPEVYPSSES
jgi:hypothetical protein